MPAMEPLEQPATHQLGDIYLIDCPCCADAIYDLWDFGIPLTPGNLIACPNCHRLLLICDARDTQLVLTPAE